MWEWQEGDGCGVRAASSPSCLPLAHGSVLAWGWGSAGSHRAVIPLLHCIHCRKGEHLILKCLCFLFNPENLICPLLHCQQLRKRILSCRAMDLKLLRSN